MGKEENYPTISVLICTLNEEENLPHILPAIPDWVDEILLVDGHSTDATVEVAKRLCPRIHVVYQLGKGKGDALKMGINEAMGEIIVTLDADGATDPCEIDKFIKPLLNGYDFVKGSRFIKGKTYNKPWHRVLGNWIIILTFDVLFLRVYTDMCSGYNAFWREKVKALSLFSADGYENEPLINARIAKSRLRVTEAGHTDKGRIKGDVKEDSWRQGFKALKSIVRERFNE